MTELSFDDRLREGLAAYKRGAFADAVSHYEAALAAEPDNPEALSLYGVSLLRAGRIEEARAPLLAAVGRAPETPGYIVNLSDLYLATGETARAVELLRQCVSANPGYALAWRRLGEAYIAEKNYKAAADALDEALQIKSDDYDLAVQLARALGAAENFKAADYVLGHAERLRPNGLAARRAHVDISRVQQNWEFVERGAQRILTEDRDDVEAWRNLAFAYIETGRYSDAQAALLNVMERTAPSAELYAQFAKVAIDALEFDKAEKALAEAEALDPDFPFVLSTKALLRLYQGRLKEAEDYCRRCLEIEPEFFAVYPQLSVLKKGSLSGEQEEFLKTRARQEGIPLSSRAVSSFLAAGSYDAHGRIDEAFEEYLYANDLGAERNHRENLIYDYAGHSAWVDAVIETFGDAPPADSPSLHEGPQPIFIVGLPRSGSTLVESVISAHSRVTDWGEAPMMPPLFIDWFKANRTLGAESLTPETARLIAETYIQRSPVKAVSDFVTDKNLLNIEAAGLIARVFPRAKVINVRRNPMECGFSIFRHDLPKFWTYAFDLENIGRRYGLYAKISAHFERVLPGRFFTVQYEDFARNFEERARDLIQKCDLDWEDACGAFQETDRVAATLSAVQVREPVALGKSKAALYAERLEPLRAALVEAGVDLETGALRV